VSEPGADGEDDGRSLTLPYRARFDECGPDGLVRSSTLLRYAQDLAWIHSEALGFTRDWYAERNRAWVVRAAELAILAPLPLGQTITLRTEVVGFRRVWARRRTEGRLADGELALWGHTDWVILDTARGLPTRFPPEFLERFDVPSQAFEPGRVSLPPAEDAAGAPATGHRTRARPQDADPMGHVNNAAYLDYLEEALLASGGDAALLPGATPRRFRIEYLQAAAPDADLVSRTWPLPAGPGAAGGWAWRLDGPGGELARGLATPDGG